MSPRNLVPASAVCGESRSCDVPAASPQIPPAAPAKESDGMDLTMTEEVVSNLCKAKGFYRTPELNERLYLHFQGFTKIQNLESFYNCQALWLESNAIDTIENLEALPKLASLFIQHNRVCSLVREYDIDDYTEATAIQSRWHYFTQRDQAQKSRHVDPSGVAEDQESLEAEAVSSGPTLPVIPILDCEPSGWPLKKPFLPTCGTLPTVTNLNISHNMLESCAGISITFPNLERLLASHNKLTNITEVKEMARLTVLDISFNKLVGGDVLAHGCEGSHAQQCQTMACATQQECALLSTLETLPELASLMMHGNPIVRTVPFYRKKIICALSALKYLDEYPIFDDERRAAQAFGQGGGQAETAERAAIQAEASQKRKDNHRAFDEMLAKAKASQPQSEGEDEFDDVHVGGGGP